METIGNKGGIFGRKGKFSVDLFSPALWNRRWENGLLTSTFVPVIIDSCQVLSDDKKQMEQAILMTRYGTFVQKTTFQSVQRSILADNNFSHRNTIQTEELTLIGLGISNRLTDGGNLIYSISIDLNFIKNKLDVSGGK